MISSISQSSARTYSTQQKSNNQRQNSPSFKGGESALIGFITYTVADYIAILGGCSHVDFIFRKLGLRDARDFGVRSIKRKHSKKFNEISNLSAHIAQSLKENPLTQKLGKRLQRVHETIFNLPLKPAEGIAKPKGSLQDQLVALHEKIESLFVNMNDTQRFTAIGKPLDTNIANISKALAKINHEAAPEVFDPFRKTIPNASKSQRR